MTETSNRPPKPFPWATALGVAGLLVLLFGTQNFLAMLVQDHFVRRAGLAGRPVGSWVGFILHEVPVWYSIAVLSPVIFALARRFPVTGNGFARGLGVHAAASLLITAALMLTSTAVARAAGEPASPLRLTYLEAAEFGLVRYFGYFLTIYALVVAMHHAAAYYTAFQSRALWSAQLEARLTRASLDVLKMQIHPHFLFNTLNTISALMYSDMRAAQNTIVQLSELLRVSLENPAVHEVPLQEEISFLSKYLEIQQVRFQDRLQVTWDLQPESLDLLVPRLLLQPLVENSIRHGLEAHSEPARISIRSRVHDGRLRLSVRDDGTGSRSRAGTGIGLQNTQARLAHLYGSEYRFEAGPALPRGYAVELEIPARG